MFFYRTPVEKHLQSELSKITLTGGVILGNLPGGVILGNRNFFFKNFTYTPIILMDVGLIVDVGLMDVGLIVRIFVVLTRVFENDTNDENNGNGICGNITFWK